jgi:hypothetical protein
MQMYDGRRQPAVTYIVDSWKRAVPDASEAAFLEDSRWTQPSTKHGRRTVERAGLMQMFAATDMTDEAAVRRAFVLVMAWGSGTSNTRSYRYTRKALTAPNCTKRLVRAAESCRDGDLLSAYSDFSLPGVGRSFFTKWFAFAGRVPGRNWQPLILDDRVLRTLNRTLGLSTRALAGSPNWGRRYAAYVEHLHSWGHEVGCSADRLEWILFAHNGEPMPPLVNSVR